MYVFNISNISTSGGLAVWVSEANLIEAQESGNPRNAASNGQGWATCLILVPGIRNAHVIYGYITMLSSMIHLSNLHHVFLMA